MSFKSILKHIGQAVNAADQFIPEYGAQIHALTDRFLPGSDNKISAIMSTAQDKLDIAVGIVVDAEVAGQALNVAGPDKARLAAPKLAQLFLDLAIVRGKSPKDPEAFKAHTAALGGAIADLLNDFEA